MRPNYEGLALKFQLSPSRPALQCGVSGVPVLVVLRTHPTHGAIKWPFTRPSRHGTSSTWIGPDRVCSSPEVHAGQLEQPLRDHCHSEAKVTSAFGHLQ
jgi:hypothetical protein